MTTDYHAHINSDGFRLRGTAVSRIDGFSDVVFSFALTLLLVSLEIPTHEGLVGLLSCLLTVVLPNNLSGWAGFTYMLIGVTKSRTGAGTGRAERSMRGTTTG